MIKESFQGFNQNWRTALPIVFLILGPFILLQALAEFLGGRSLLISEDAHQNFFTELTGIFQSEEAIGEPTGVWAGLIEFVSLFFYPLVYAALIMTISKWLDGKNTTKKEAFQHAKSKYGPVLGAIIIFTVILTAISIVLLLLSMSLAIQSLIAFLAVGGIILMFAGLLLTKISLFLGNIILNENNTGLGFSDSWEYTRDRTFYAFGFYILLLLIGIAINMLFQTFLGAFVGNSVLAGLLINAVGLVVTFFYVTAYTVLYREVHRLSQKDHEEELEETSEV